MSKTMSQQRHQSVLVTGAAGSLGLETVLAAAERGFRVFAGTRGTAQHAAIQEAAAGRGVQVDTITLDVTDESSVAAAIDHIVRVSGNLYGIVNNAGVTLRGYFEDLEDAEIRRLFDVNLFGTMAVTRHALPYMREARRGRIIIMSSVAGRIGSMGLTAYVASKFALEGFSESLALEVAPLGVDVAVIEPGIVRTGIWEQNRRVAARARDPKRPYYKWFTRAEAEADRLVKSSKLTPTLVARGIVRALTDSSPRMRYMVGRRASLVVALRRHLPGELFERIYFGEVRRRVIGSRGLVPAEPRKPDVR